MHRSIRGAVSIWGVRSLTKRSLRDGRGSRAPACQHRQAASTRRLCASPPGRRKGPTVNGLVGKACKEWPEAETSKRHGARLRKQDSCARVFRWPAMGSDWGGARLTPSAPRGRQGRRGAAGRARGEAGIAQ